MSTSIEEIMNFNQRRSHDLLYSHPIPSNKSISSENNICNCIRIESPIEIQDGLTTIFVPPPTSESKCQNCGKNNKKYYGAIPHNFLTEVLRICAIIEDKYGRIYSFKGVKKRGFPDNAVLEFLVQGRFLC